MVCHIFSLPWCHGSRHSPFQALDSSLRGAEGVRDVHVSGWGDRLVGKSACYVNMKVSGCAGDPSAVGTGTRGSLGFVGHQPSARFNERPCLKGRKWRVISRTPDVLLWPLLGHPPSTCTCSRTHSDKTKERCAFDYKVYVPGFPDAGKNSG